MRSSFMIFLLGLVLGSTLGIGGIWTQVVQPAAAEIQQLEQEHGIMQTALDEASHALKEVVTNLREGEARTAPIRSGDIVPRGDSSIAPEDEPTKAEPKEIANRLDNLANRLDAARFTRRTSD